MDEDKKKTLKHKIDELRSAADWRDGFVGKQQDKAKFFITLVTTETFAIGLSLNTMPPQKWLWVPSAVTFLVCFGACFWSMYYFACVIEPRNYRAVDEGRRISDIDGEEEALLATKDNIEQRNKDLDCIVDIQAVHLRRGVRSFFIFNFVFAVALVVSRLAWFFPAD